MFLGRLQELTALQAEYARSRPSLILVRGRRRVGKSTLILKSLEGRPEVREELLLAPLELQEFVRKEFTALLAHPDFEETLQGTFTEAGRDEVVLRRVKQIAASDEG